MGYPYLRKHTFNAEELGEAYLDRDGYHEVGRLNYSFMDENMVIPSYNKKIKDMTAQEIIQYTLDNLGEQYITGLDSYTGSLYDTSKYEKIQLSKDIIVKNEAAAESVKSSQVVLRSALSQANEAEVLIIGD